jgi:putative flippase GtrA
MIFLRYLVIQLLAYVIDMGIFLLLLSLNLFDPIFSNVIGKFFAGCFAFTAHRIYTFHVSRINIVRKQAIRYFLILVINIPASSYLLGVILNLISFPFLAKFMADVLCVLISYGFAKYFIFNQNSKKII